MKKVMEKEQLIKKWLDKDLSAQELEAFKLLNNYEALLKLSRYTKEYKAPDFDTEKTFYKITKTIENKKQVSKHWYKPLLKIAAIVAVCFGFYYYTSTLDSEFSSALAQKTSIELPDLSLVNLNASSKITFNKKKWEDSRNLTLEGEAFFKVKKGSSFNVITKTGTVTVLGTQFNVKQRKNHFEVICFEGLVEVTYNNTKTKLAPGQSFLYLNGQIRKNNATTGNKPNWLKNNMSAFKSMPLGMVLKEFERQYNVTIDASKIDNTKIYTGKFTHNDIKVAIKSITEPLQLNYTIKNNIITLRLE